MHLYQAHSMTLARYRLDFPQSIKKEEAPNNDAATGNLFTKNAGIGSDLAALPGGESIHENSMDTALGRSDSAMGKYIQIGHRKRTNFNMLVGNTQFSFNDKGLAFVSVARRSCVEALLRRPGYYLVEEDSSKDQQVVETPESEVAAPVAEEPVEEPDVEEDQAEGLNFEPEVSEEPEVEDTVESFDDEAESVDDEAESVDDEDSDISDADSDGAENSDDTSEEESADDEEEASVDDESDSDEDVDDYDARKASLEEMLEGENGYRALQVEAKEAGVKASGKGNKIIQRILDAEYEDADEDEEDE